MFPSTTVSMVRDRCWMEGLRVELGEVANVGGFCASVVEVVLMLNGVDLGGSLAKLPRLLQSPFFEEVHSTLFCPRIVCFDEVKSSDM
jgi:hypothetical protein